MAARIISVLNYKGGVGKTTTTANLGTALWILGKRVCLIDTDVQCNLTHLLGFSHAEKDDTLHDWLLSDCPPPIYERYDGLYYIPSGRDASFESSLDKSFRREEVLSRKLSELKKAFDYILIDCSPKEGLMNINAMAASDEVLIPIECSGFSLQGMQSLLSSLQKINKELNPSLKLLGILLVKYDSNTRISQEMTEYFKTTFPDKLLSTRIRKNVRFDESPLTNQTCFELAPDANGSTDYMALAEELTGVPRPNTWKEIALAAWKKFKQQ